MRLVTCDGCFVVDVADIQSADKNRVREVYDRDNTMSSPFST